MRPLRLALLQFAPTLRDVHANIERIAQAAPARDCDVLITPELSLTGYSVADDAAALALPLREGEPVPAPYHTALAAIAPALLAGLLERPEAGSAPYNSAALLDRGTVRHHHRKIYLPTYGMFDEARFFARGSELRTCALPGGWRGGVLVCEDFWHPALAYILAAAGIQVLLVLAAAPGRAVLEGGDTGAVFGSADAWERIARTTAQLYGIYVALANRTGVEGGVTFGGGSLIVDPSGTIVAQGDAFGDALLHVELEPAVLAAARQPYAHARDDDPHLTLRLLREQVAR
ncbi:MAG: nitrilase-related carbon-nitrogen hydrolase [Longimicrobiales bacterium]